MDATHFSRLAALAILLASPASAAADELPSGAPLLLGTRAFRHTVGVSDVAWSPDGTRIASAGLDKKVRVMDATSGLAVMADIAHESVVLSVRFTVDAKELLSSDQSGTLIVTDPEARVASTTLTFPGSVLIVSPDGRKLAGAGRSPNQVELFDRDGALQRTITLPLDLITDAAFFADGRRLAVVGFVRTEGRAKDGVYFVLDVLNGETVMTSRTPGAWAQSVAPENDGARLATGCTDGTMRLFDVGTGALVSGTKCHEGTIGAVACSPDGQWIVSGGNDRKLGVHDGKTGHLLHSFPAHTAAVTCVAFAPDGQRFVSGAQDMLLKIWEPETGKLLNGIPGHTAVVSAVAGRPDGTTVATAGYDGTVMIWDLATGKLDHAIDASHGLVFDVRWSPSGDLLAAGIQEGGLVLFYPADKSAVRLSPPQGALAAQCLDFAPDGKRIVVAHGDNVARIWDVEKREVARTIKLARGTLLSAAWAPDGKAIALGASKVSLFDSDTGELLRTFEDQTCPVDTMRFFADGTLLAVASGDTLIRIYDVASGAVVGTLAGHTGRVHGLAISPDGKTIASSSYNETAVRLFDVATRTQRGELQGHELPVLALTFVKDGRLVSGSLDATALVWKP